ncbi:alanyl-tRNA synthetase [Candidatus Caldarchaeum subterraneum]|uniref:Alanine--tRNA ligase n=1 Tax=Caldiarchaeum subterraneum TaxID=311458 RepID=E6N4E7_CALS0|nr:alanyl-tRNA synthetase [Candidatus Caldarchaeum subterraneum]BAJ50021.1 alanyl-tRNA synthetase [Candidatus Caldarchaeum subterraneum]
MPYDEHEYRFEFFLQNGFVRSRCRVCGEFFWSLDPGRDVCGESPCVEYSFLEKKYCSKPLSVREARQSFIEFFAQRGHAPIKPYPIVARWRTDLYLTDASIVDFQPWVTNGIAPPPANPLVISQPCARLVDLDKIGLTFGRHLTVFEMGGHHAFNYPEKKIYWKSETAEYCHEFMTSVLGVPTGELVYKESWWAGGGNEGPCLEVIAGGLELATLVFMQFKTLDGERAETPIKTVDTGYGIERLAWFSQQTPSAFDAIYGELLAKVRELIPVNRPDEELLIKYAKYTGLVKPGADATVSELRRKVASMAGISVETVNEQIVPYEKVYQALDYSKAIAFIVAEGVVPSNVKTGYLTRLLIRRAYRLLRMVDAEEKLLDLVDLQIRYWEKDFPHLSEMREEVLDIVEHEVNKFRETIKRGTETVLRELRSTKAISVEKLIQYYDDKGLTPDIVAEVAAKQGVEVTVPENFYELVASRHLREKPVKTTMQKQIDVSSYPKTHKLYYEQPNSYSFRAKVLGVENGYVILDATLFYPEGGGAVGDTGTLVCRDKVCTVVDTQILEDVVVHRVEGPVPDVGEEVEGYVDAERRQAIVRHHTATHILLGAVRRVLGKHAWQAGARKEPEKGRLDFYHHKRLTLEQIREIEKLANRVVARRIPVRIKWMDRNEAEETYGFGLYQGGEVPLGVIRVVEIPGWDAEACGGIHCENTEDVGLIKIVSSERIQDGVERIEFVAGPANLHRYQGMETMLHEVAEKLQAPVEDIPKKVAELDENLRILRKTVKTLSEKLIVYRAAEIRSVGIAVDSLLLYISEEEYDDEEYLIKLAAEIVKVDKPAVALAYAGTPSAKVVAVANDKAVAAGVNVGEVLRKFLQLAGGGGGGSRTLGRGAAPREQLVYNLPELSNLLRNTRGPR